MLKALLEEKNLSVYQAAKLSGIPYTTLSELVRQKTSIEKCTAEVVYRLARLLGVSMEMLLENTVEEKADFEIFKSNVCHSAKENTLDFIITTIKRDDVRKYWKKRWYQEAFYLLATIDYLCRLYDIPQCKNYDDIRAHSLKRPLYARDVLLQAKLHPRSRVKEICQSQALPEFLRFNIIESEIFHVF